MVCWCKSAVCLLPLYSLLSQMQKHSWLLLTMYSPYVHRPPILRWVKKHVNGVLSSRHNLSLDLHDHSIEVGSCFKPVMEEIACVFEQLNERANNWSPSTQ